MTCTEHDSAHLPCFSGHILGDLGTFTSRQPGPPCISMFSSSQMETVELSKLDLAFISCEPARFLTESTSHFSKVLLTRLMWGRFSWSRGGILLLLGGLRSGFLQEQECWVPAERLRSPREMATSSGDSAPLMLPVKTPASLQEGSASSLPQASLGFQPLLPPLSFPGHSPCQ